MSILLLMFVIFLYERSIPVRSFFGDLNKKSPLGMIRGCQSHELTPNLNTKEDYTLILSQTRRLIKSPIKRSAMKSIFQSFSSK